MLTATIVAALMYLNIITTPDQANSVPQSVINDVEMHITNEDIELM